MLLSEIASALVSENGIVMMTEETRSTLVLRIQRLESHGPMDPSTLKIITTDYPLALQRIEELEKQLSERKGV